MDKRLTFTEHGMQDAVEAIRQAIVAHIDGKGLCLDLDYRNRGVKFATARHSDYVYFLHPSENFGWVFVSGNREIAQLVDAMNYLKLGKVYKI